MPSEDPFDKVLKKLGLYDDIRNMPSIPPAIILEQQGNINEVLCRVRVRDRAGKLLKIAQVPNIPEQLRWCWFLACIKFIHPTPGTANRIRPFDLILNLNGTMYPDPVHMPPGNQSGVYPSRCRIPQSTIVGLPKQEQLWRAEKFALGALLYEILTSHRPFEGLTDDEVQDHYAAARFPTDLRDLPVLFQTLIYACWSSEFGCYIALGKFLRYVNDHPIRFGLQVGSVILSVAAVITVPVLGAVGFSSIGPVAGSAAAAWQASIGAVEAGSLFALCQSAAMGGAAVSGLAGIGSASAAIGLVASSLPDASSLRGTFIRKFRKGTS
jgi:hypothetical protein